ncbi:MAG: heparinase II/III family protein [Deinococcales bacterium]
MSPFTLETLDFVHLERILEQSRTVPYRVFTEANLALLRRAPHLEAFRAELMTLVLRDDIPTLSYSAWRTYERTGERTDYDKPYFERRALLAGLALHCVLEPDDSSALKRLHNLIYAILEESTWANPPHVAQSVFEAGQAFEVIDLFAAETAHALAETLSLLGERLETALQNRILLELERRIWNPYARLERPVWEAKRNNWSAVCSSCLGMVALLTLRDPKRIIGVIARVLETLKIFFSGYSQSGATPEGIAYWRYGFGYFVYFAQMLREYSDGQIDLLLSKKAQRIALFPVALSLGEDRFVNFSDAPEYCPLEAGLLSHLKHRLGVQTPMFSRVASIHRDHCYRFAHLTRNLFWTDPECFQTTTPSGLFVFPELAWLTHRAHGFVFAIKGGHNDEPHNQNDLGQFILHAHGDTLLCDLGRGQYTKEYFSEARYTLLHTSSRGHNVPVLNGYTQAAGADFFGELLHYALQNNVLKLLLDLSNAYPDPALLHYTRAARWYASEQRAQLELTDTLQFSRPSNSIESAFISLFEPVLEQHSIVWRGQKAQLTLHYPEGWQVQLECIDSKAHLGETLKVYRSTCKIACGQYISATFHLTLELLEP